MVNTNLWNNIGITKFFVTHTHSDKTNKTQLTFSFWVPTVFPLSSLDWSGVQDSSSAAPPACRSPPVSHLWCRGSRRSACQADPPPCSPSSRACWRSLSWHRLPAGRLLSVHLHPVQNKNFKCCTCSWVSISKVHQHFPYSKSIKNLWLTPLSVCATKNKTQTLGLVPI